MSKPQTVDEYRAHLSNLGRCADLCMTPFWLNPHFGPELGYVDTTWAPVSWLADAPEGYSYEWAE